MGSHKIPARPPLNLLHGVLGRGGSGFNSSAYVSPTAKILITAGKQDNAPGVNGYGLCWTKTSKGGGPCSANKNAGGHLKP